MTVALFKNHRISDYLIAGCALIDATCALLLS